MTPEEREMLKRVYQMTEENNDMLVSMRRSMRLSRIWSIIYWTVIIGSAVGAYYFIEPYIDQILGIYGSASDDINNAKNILNSLKP